MMPAGGAGLSFFVRGVVQGVGFRPFIYSLAVRHALTGWVRNTSAGVEIAVFGAPQQLEQFARAIQAEKPPLARIDELRRQPLPYEEFSAFSILASQAEEGQFMPISPDVALCPDCRRELLDPADRRYRYPFINCTNCGPRFTIIEDIPYDRPKTTMRAFALCAECQAEYDDPLNRRFHAQPVACPACGPQVRWLATTGQSSDQFPRPNSPPPISPLTGEAAIQAARQALQAGQVVALKGLGGFHLACDAANPQAVASLRARKKRSDKPFALMAYDLETIRRFAQLSPAEAALLAAPQAPILLLERLPGCPLDGQVAPGQRSLGFMLPYTPLHLLLLEPAPGFPQALVMTSGNLSEEPVAYLDEEGLERLAPLADGFLLHDRPIHMRTDDSVARMVGQRTYLLRRARGYAPDSIPLPGFDRRMPSVLAAGAELKNTFCLTRGGYAFLSHHIGDMENYETLRSFEEGIEHFQRLFRILPEALACDLHPDYLATRAAQALAAARGLPLLETQHHHAHLAAVLADHGWNHPPGEPVIGLIFDGTGLGQDRAIWGGEMLVGGYSDFQRACHLAYTPLPGGDSSVRKPARMALAHLWQAGLDWEADLPPVQALCSEERSALRGQLEHGLNSPPTSSMGRLFDAAAALIGLRQTVTYEGQAAIELEAIADPQEEGCYPFDLRGEVLDPLPVWQGLLRDWRSGQSQAVLAARFHNSVARACLEMARAARQNCASSTVALSGGVWQNIRLLTSAIRLLEEDHFNVLWHRQVPANDGGISLGQALIVGVKLGMEN